MAGQEIGQSRRTEPRFFYGYIVVAAALCIMVVSVGTYLAFGVFFKPVLIEFGWTRATTSGAFSLATIVSGLLAIVMGRLNDRFGPRIVLTLSGFLLGLGYLLMSQISAVWQLYLFYGVIIGIGMSGVIIPIMTTVARWFFAKRSTMTGIVVSGAGIGMLIMPPVASRLISAYDWRMSYIMVGIVVLVVVVLAAQFLKQDPSQIGQLPDGESKRGEEELKLRVDGFSLREAVCTRQFWLVFAMFFCSGFATLTIMVHIIPHATDLGNSANSAASVLAIIGGVTIVGTLVLGAAADRIGNRQVFIIGFVMKSAFLIWLALATDVWMLYLFAIVFGLTQGTGASESPLVARLFGLRSHGLILGIAEIGFTSGAAIGPWLSGYLFDVTGSYQVAFFVCGGITIAALVLTILLTPIKGRQSI